jgi:hypothetical protein
MYYATLTMIYTLSEIVKLKMDKSKLKDAGEKMEKADEKKKDTSTSDAGSAKKVSISIVNDLKKKKSEIKLS